LVELICLSKVSCTKKVRILSYIIGDSSGIGLPSGLYIHLSALSIEKAFLHDINVANKYLATILKSFKKIMRFCIN